MVGRVRRLILLELLPCVQGQTHEVRLVACWLGKRKGKGGAWWLGENCPVEVQINC